MPDPLRTAGDIVGFIARQPPMMDVLRLVEALDLPDCWIGAGFVRNAVWDALHDRPWSPSYGDIDVVYFDVGDAGAERDIALEARLARSMPGAPWSVKNQARMHAANGDPPYAGTADALAHWPETCTAVAVRSIGSRVELLAPFGISDLVTLTVKATPAFAGKPGIYRARIARKEWGRRWPRLRIEGRRG
ncbi:MAG TPA: nucleotidyltransferase family protein [Alphaproteobacteria bacterium]|jgi:hypothetical protein|nr:nucleotidyltransferase family protein [Alphaproteobacteria bacterium]